MKLDVIRGIEARLEDTSYRREYGAATAKYDFAYALSEARRRNGLTQRQMANITGVSQAYIARLESGEANPSIAQLGKLLASIWLRGSFETRPLLNPEAASTIHLESNPADQGSTKGEIILGGDPWAVIGVIDQPHIHTTPTDQNFGVGTTGAYSVVHLTTTPMHVAFSDDPSAISRAEGVLQITSSQPFGVFGSSDIFFANELLALVGKRRLVYVEEPMPTASAVGEQQRLRRSLISVRGGR
jgi:transcriptional regulator with XRE-family HTH domain